MAEQDLPKPNPEITAKPRPQAREKTILVAGEQVVIPVNLPEDHNSNFILERGPVPAAQPHPEPVEKPTFHPDTNLKDLTHDPQAVDRVRRVIEALDQQTSSTPQPDQETEPNQ